MAGERDAVADVAESGACGCVESPSDSADEAPPSLTPLARPLNAAQACSKPHKYIICCQRAGCGGKSRGDRRAGFC